MAKLGGITSMVTCCPRIGPSVVNPAGAAVASRLSSATANANLQSIQFQALTFLVGREHLVDEDRAGHRGANDPGFTCFWLRLRK